ncbi:MAG: hypothetical protein ACI93T_001079 [Porticoccaceae bacterium]|jgi:hypothetical protein
MRSTVRWPEFGPVNKLIPQSTTDECAVARNTLKAFYPIARGRRIAAHPWLMCRISFYPARVTQIEQAVERFQRTGLRFFTILGWRFADPRLMGQTPAA